MGMMGIPRLPQVDEILDIGLAEDRLYFLDIISFGGQAQLLLTREQAALIGVSIISDMRKENL